MFKLKHSASAVFLIFCILFSLIYSQLTNGGIEGLSSTAPHKAPQHKAPQHKAPQHKAPQHKAPQPGSVMASQHVSSTTPKIGFLGL